MAKQDDWTRLTVRIPPELYERLQAAILAGPNSMNAEIVARLERSLENVNDDTQGKSITKIVAEATTSLILTVSSKYDELFEALADRTTELEELNKNLREELKRQMKEANQRRTRETGRP